MRLTEKPHFTMSASQMITHLLLERLSRRPLARVPETSLVMDAPDQIDAFAASGRGEGVLHYIYLFHAIQSLPVIRPGDRVLDLACGPANQLVEIARLNPDAEFIGLDASHNMLKQASHTLASHQISNISLMHGDAARLDGFEPASVDTVLCTMSLHHLPDTTALANTMREIRRVLKPGGGIYLADFGRLKRQATQQFFAYDRAEMQSEQFTQDFLNSMRAAFSLDEMQQALQQLGIPLKAHQTAIAPFMLICRSAARAPIDRSRLQRVKASWDALPALLQRDFNNLARWFTLGGLRLPCKLR